MTIAKPAFDSERAWHGAFSTLELDILRTSIPYGIHAAQVRTGRAHTEYADPEGELHVYGVGMSKAAPKEICALLRELPSYREVPIPKTSRHLMFVGRALIFPIRVGEKMRRNKKRLWLRSFSESRQQYLAENSTQRREVSSLTLFDEDLATAERRMEDTNVVDALRHIEQDEGSSELFVPFFSSTPLGVGQIMWAPARLNGRYLHFIEPESLTYRKMEASVPINGKPQPVDGFAETPRPRTIVTRRRQSARLTDQD